MSQKGYQIVKLKQDKNTFELLTKPGKALKFREGKCGWNEVLFSDEIYKNPSKGERFTGKELNKTFGTENLEEVAKIIIEKGELQLSAQERKEKMEQIRNGIVTYISQYYIDPKIKNAIPRTRVEAAMESLKFRIDSDLPVEKQALDLVKKFPNIGLVVKKVETLVTLTIPYQYLHQTKAIIYGNARIQGQKQTDEGIEYQVSMIPGDYDKIISSLNKVTKGDYQMKLN